MEAGKKHSLNGEAFLGSVARICYVENIIYADHDHDYGHQKNLNTPLKGGHNNSILVTTIKELLW